jgi:aspartate-semialdehyde dehydrogenase
VFIETEREISSEQLTQKLSVTEGIEVYPSNEEYPMQLGVAGSDTIHVGRIRKDESVPHGVSLWVVADNVRKGAAVNAVQIAERLLAEE